MKLSPRPADGAFERLLNGITKSVTQYEALGYPESLYTPTITILKGIVEMGCDQIKATQIIRREQNGTKI